MSDPADLEAFLAQAWQGLTRGVADRAHPARHPVLATVSPDGQPEARTVVLRAADRAAGMVEVHTDLASAKVAALAQNARAQLHVWDGRRRLQTRLFVVVSVLSGADVAEAWARVPDGSRRAYGADPAPGMPIAEPFAYAPGPAAARFAILRCRIDRIDLLHLGTDHRRAAFARSEGWAGQWLVP